MSDTELKVFHTEDLNRDFTFLKRKAEFKDVRSPTIAQSEPIAFEDAVFTATAKFKGRVLKLTTTISDAVGAKVNIFADSLALTEFKGLTGTWEILMEKAGVTKRMIGGSITIKTGADF